MWVTQSLLPILSLTLLLMALGAGADDADPIGQGVQDGPDPLKCLMNTAANQGNTLMPLEVCPDSPFVPQVTNDPEPFAP